MIPVMDPVAEWVVSVTLSVALLLGSLGFALFCVLVVCNGVWVFLRTICPHVRHRRVARGFDVLPARVRPLSLGRDAMRGPARLAGRVRMWQK